MNDKYELRVSGLASGRVNWDAIDDSLIGIQHLGKNTETEEPLTRQDVERVLGAAQVQFSQASEQLRLLTRWLIVGLGLVLIACAAAIVLSTTFQSIISGAVVSTVSVVALLGLVLQIYRLGRDQMLFDIIPARYSVALQLASSPDHFREIIDRFLSETTPLRPKKGKSRRRPSPK